MNETRSVSANNGLVSSGVDEFDIEQDTKGGSSQAGGDQVSKSLKQVEKLGLLKDISRIAAQIQNAT